MNSENISDIISEIIIDGKYCGPSDSGQGGYVCGRLAAFISGAAEVTLRMPPPLDRKLIVMPGAGHRLQLLHGSALVAEAEPAVVEMAVPDPPDFSGAESASASYPGFEHHAFPLCFVCGPKRSGDGAMRIFAGRVPGRDIVASPWIPDVSFAGAGGCVRPEFIWAALDCPGAMAVVAFFQTRRIMLGKLAVRIEGAVRPGERCVVTGWGVGRNGRKIETGTALFSGDGRLCARARGTWIELKA